MGSDGVFFWSFEIIRIFIGLNILSRANCLLSLLRMKPEIFTRSFKVRRKKGL